MSSTLAAEGAYQVFEIAGGEWAILIGSALTAILDILVGIALMRGVLAQDAGTPKMQEIAKAIREGATAYLNRQFKTIAVIVIPVAAIVFLTSTEVFKPGTEDGLTYFESGAFRTGAFLLGCLM